MVRPSFVITDTVAAAGNRGSVCYSRSPTPRWAAGGRRVWWGPQKPGCPAAPALHSMICLAGQMSEQRRPSGPPIIVHKQGDGPLTVDILRQARISSGCRHGACRAVSPLKVVSRLSEAPLRRAWRQGRRPIDGVNGVPMAWHGRRSANSSCKLGAFPPATAYGRRRRL